MAEPKILEHINCYKSIQFEKKKHSTFDYHIKLVYIPKPTKWFSVHCLSLDNDHEKDVYIHIFDLYKFSPLYG